MVKWIKSSLTTVVGGTIGSINRRSVEEKKEEKNRCQKGTGIRTWKNRGLLQKG